MFGSSTAVSLIQESSGTSWEEMYRVFNMGHRMEIYLDKKNAQKVIDIAGEFELDAKIIGHCEAAEKTSMTISTSEGEFKY
jgi:phosphoribosylformylglycinamidine cyclo-ligase